MDTDGDGIRDTDEDKDKDGRIAGDADRDRVLDFPEHLYGGGVEALDQEDWSETDPLRLDSDGDGLEDGEEDADHDGRLDAGETDPSDRDTDNDYLSDYAEVVLFRCGGTFGPRGPNPRVPDTDGDGLLDGVEVHYVPAFVEAYRNISFGTKDTLAACGHFLLDVDGDHKHPVVDPDSDGDAAGRGIMFNDGCGNPAR